MLGIIGGTGLYQLDGFNLEESVTTDTPFGAHSGPISVGTLSEKKVAFLPRHGAGHALLPSEVNYRANIWALKNLGVTAVLSVSAVGSLKAEIKPGELSAPVQYIDFTKGKRANSFFGDGIVAHISSAEPVCKSVHTALVKSLGIPQRSPAAEAVYACVEGPRLGTRAESFMLRGVGATIVGMTGVPEVFLAREAQICYAALAVPTDYDSWHETPEEHVTVAMVLENYKRTLQRIQGLLPKFISALKLSNECSCRKSLNDAFITPESSFTPEHRELLQVLRQ